VRVLPAVTFGVFRCPEALHEQRGLRMERRREPIDVIVVEKAENVPTGN
jgi:uncharacterized protein (TIGR03435 family)